MDELAGLLESVLKLLRFIDTYANVNSGSSQSARDVDWPSRVKFHDHEWYLETLQHRHSRMELG